MAHGRDLVTDPFTAFVSRFKAARLCQRSGFSRSDFDDLKQGMMQYLLEQQGRYDPARGSPEAFVTVLINTWIAMHLRHTGRVKRGGDVTIVSLDAPSNDRSDDSGAQSERIFDADLRRRTGAHVLSQIEHLELAEAVWHAMAKLTVDEQELLWLVAEFGVAGAVREWERRRGETMSRGWVTRQISAMRRRFEDSGLSAN